MADVPPPPAAPQQGFSMLTAGGLVLAIGGLYFGQDIFVPFALAILLAFALTPLVTGLRKLRIPRIAAVIAVVAFALVVLATVAFVVGTQLVSLADNLPRYQYTIERKVDSLQSDEAGGGVLQRLTATLRDLGKGLERAEKKTDEAAANARGNAGEEPEQEPIPVRVLPPDATPLEVIQTFVGPMLAPLATAGMVVVFLIFVLLEREELRDRFIRLIGAGDLQKSTQALNDAGGRVSRYLLMQLIVNFTYGIPIGIGLYFIGVPNAILWGLLATVLRFIPYLGPFLAALFPLALAFAVDPGWTMLVWVIALFLVVELISNNAVEPWLYGTSTGLSSLAIILAAVFWTTLWGPVGLFLATPLTVCLVAIGRYVPQLEFLGVLLGNDPVLAPEQRLYQRLLAGNLEEAVELAETYVASSSSREFYDQVAIPALRMAENDGQRSTSDASYRRIVADTAICVVRDLADFIRDQKAAAEGKPAPEDDDEQRKDKPVLCIAGRTELDRAAAEMVAETLREDGIGVRALPPIMLTQDALGQLDLTGVEVVCLSYLHPEPQVYARYVTRKLKRRAPSVKVIVCTWNLPDEPDENRRRAGSTGADAIASSLTVAHGQISAWVRRSPPAGTVPPATADPERADALRAMGLKANRSERFSAVARQVAAAFETPIALVALAEQLPDPDAVGATETRIPAGVSHELASLGHLVGRPSVEVISDIEKDPRFADDPALTSNGIRFYAGAPLRLSSGVVIGTLCLIDTKQRTLSTDDVARLEQFAAGIVQDIEASHALSEGGKTIAPVAAETADGATVGGADAAAPWRPAGGTPVLAPVPVKP
ncbi:AI-2E family transporter [Mongoliimonas terrestris]|uniref:AI-2E family transporter n=1 Tax=Mongoliimonas terrestris TaxID=1709001 RepID=UPI0009498AE8|nr:AI-2E family transporter [Mongoliimonas terrestris]